MIIFYFSNSKYILHCTHSTSFLSLSSFKLFWIVNNENLYFKLKFKAHLYVIYILSIITINLRANFVRVMWASQVVLPVKLPSTPSEFTLSMWSMFLPPSRKFCPLTHVVLYQQSDILKVIFFLRGQDFCFEILGKKKCKNHT